MDAAALSPPEARFEKEDSMTRVIEEGAYWSFVVVIQDLTMAIAAPRVKDFSVGKVAAACRGSWGAISVMEAPW